MVTTTHDDLRDDNAREAEVFRVSIIRTAELMEQVRAVIGCPVSVTSGYRGPTLNARIGGSEKSQHMRGEACDFVPVGVALPVAFALLRAAVKAGRLKVGQLLLERGWCHVSLGAPYRDPARCGEIGHQRSDGTVVIDERVR
jgi:hypothetical protein